MSRSLARLLLAAILVAWPASFLAARQTPAVAVSIDAARTGPPISPLLYGKFTELLGNMYEKGVWAEMLSDRKFFYPVDSSETLTPRNSKRGFNRWRPVGPDAAITMDRTRPFVGEHSPRIALDAATPHGIRQSGLALAKGMSYTGRIELAGDRTANVSVSLVWGNGPADRQTIAVKTLTPTYAMVPLRFTAGAQTDTAALEITGVGTGSFLIGVVSLMPADNLNGFRRDLVEHLKVIDHDAIYRWPGGNFVSAYDWRDGIGDIDRRPPRYDIAWNTVEYNDVGTDEYLTLCRLIGLHPFIVVNAGLQDEYSAAAWVQYVNGAADTPMGKVRAANGHPAPYGVVYWGVGNEAFGEWQKGHMAIGDFVVRHARFAAKMRAEDPHVELIASGADTIVMSGDARLHKYLPPDPTLPYKYGSAEDWSGNLLAKDADDFSIISEHSYPYWNHAFDAASQKWVAITEPPMDQIRRGANMIRGITEDWDHYLATIPALKDRHITIALDEWSTTGGPTQRALTAAAGTMELFRRTDVYSISGFTSFAGAIAFDGRETVDSPAGLVFRLFREHYGTIPVALSGNSPQKVLAGTIRVDRGAESSGSPTYPLDMTAALSADRRTLTLAVLNPSTAAADFDLAVSGATPGPGVHAWRVQTPDYTTANTPGKPPVVTIKDVPAAAPGLHFTAPPISVTVYAFDLR